MGHKLVAVLGHELPRLILTAGVINNNKIPFRPFLDREAANNIMPYHTTLFQWDKQQDIFYLQKMADLTFKPCKVVAEEFAIMNSTGYSYLLFVRVTPGDGFQELCQSISEVTGRPLETYLRVSLSCSKDQKQIREQYKALTKTIRLPVELPIRGLELFHIWDPIKRVRSITEAGNLLIPD